MFPDLIKRLCLSTHRRVLVLLTSFRQPSVQTYIMIFKFIIYVDSNFIGKITNIINIYLNSFICYKDGLLINFAKRSFICNIWYIYPPISSHNNYRDEQSETKRKFSRRKFTCLSIH